MAAGPQSTNWTFDATIVSTNFNQDNPTNKGKIMEDTTVLMEDTVITLDDALDNILIPDSTNWSLF